MANFISRRIMEMIFRSPVITWILIESNQLAEGFFRDHKAFEFKIKLDEENILKQKAFT